MKKFLLLGLCCFLVCAAVAQKLNIKSINKHMAQPKKTGHTNQVGSYQFADTLYQYMDGVGTPEVYTFDYTLPYDTGFYGGTNIFGLRSYLQKYDLAAGGTLSSVLFGVGMAGDTGILNVRIWADSSGFPGQLIEDVVVPISQIDTSSANQHYFFYSTNYTMWDLAVDLPIPLTFSAGTSFWAGIYLPSKPTDTLAMICSNQSFPPSPSLRNNVREQWKDSTAFHTAFEDSGTDIVFAIFPVITYSCAITGNVFNDLNNNNIKDAGDIGLVNVKVVAGNFIGFSDANGDYIIYVDSGNYVLNAPNVSYGTCGPASINASVPISGSISSNNDFAAHFTPNVRDLDGKLIYGIFRPGFNGDYFVSVKNNGTQTDSGTVSVTLDDSLSFISSWPAPNSVAGNNINLNYPPLMQGESAILYISSYVPSTIGINYTLSSNALVNPLLNDSNSSNNYDTIRHLTQGAYDPNIKQVFPEGDISPAFVSGGNYLNYTVQFQNTGNDTAFNIRVVDTLSANLDLTSLEVLNASHKYTVGVQNNRVTFFFNHILLLDSGRDQLKSHGFVSYKIKPKTTLNLGDQIKNTAYIYFDYNAPVVTGTTLNTVSVTTTSVADLSKSDARALAVFPNPFINEVTFSFAEAGEYTIKVMDILGAVKLTAFVKNSKNYKADLSSLPSGCFIITAEGAKGIYKTKIIKN
jgi:uncharacterized repeat protein (TIGR01451 family)